MDAGVSSGCVRESHVCNSKGIAGAKALRQGRAAEEELGMLGTCQPCYGRDFPLGAMETPWEVFLAGVAVILGGF